MAVWIVVTVVGAATVALKALGPLALGGRELPPRFIGLVALLAPALLAALVVTQTLGEDEGLVVDERLAGVAAGAGALALRAPLLAVVVVAAAVTAATRALTG
jgi:branched-subunit amino acid transport protein